MAKLTIAFGAWKEGKVSPSLREVAIVLPKQSNIKLAAVSPKLLRELIHPNKTCAPHGLRFSPDGQRIIAGDYPGGIVAVWDVETGKRLVAIETGSGGRGSADYFFITPDWQTLFVSQPGQRRIDKVEKNGKTAIRWTYDGSISSWNLATGELLKTLRHDPPRFILAMGFSPKGAHFVTSEWLPGISDGRPNAGASLWNVDTGKWIDLGGNVETYSRFSPDGKTLAATTVDKDFKTTALILFDSATGKPKLSIPVDDKNARTFISNFSPDGKWMLVGSQIFDKPKNFTNWQVRLDVHESATGKKVASLHGEPNQHLNATFAPDGKTLAIVNTRGKDHKLFLFNVAENRVVKTIHVGSDAKGDRFLIGINPIFSPDGKRLAVGTQVLPEPFADDLTALDVAQPRVLLFDVETGTIRDTLVLPQGYSRAACVSPDGRTLAVGGYGRVLLWNVDSRGKKP